MANTAENAKLMYEAGQTHVAMVALSDDGDHKTFNSGAQLWSDKSSYSPVIRPNGLISGGAITPGSANDTVDVAALTCYLAGELKSVAAASGVSVTRAITDTHIINSITVDSTGAIVVIAGSEGTSFSETRGAAGGPPYIPTDSIEIGQVRLSSNAAAAVTADEIFTTVGTHRERWDYPLWNVEYARVSGGALGYAGITFLSELPLIHTGGVPKAVYAEYYTPNFAELFEIEGMKLPETSHSVSSTQVYGGTVGATSMSLGQGSFTAYLQDGVSDALVQLKDEKLWFKFYPDRYKSAYALCQGKLGITRTFPAGGSISATCTISATEPAKEIYA
jgi:hypothetical protein